MSIFLDYRRKPTGNLIHLPKQGKSDERLFMLRAATNAFPSTLQRSTNDPDSRRSCCEDEFRRLVFEQDDVDDRTRSFSKHPLLYPPHFAWKAAFISEADFKV